MLEAGLDEEPVREFGARGPAEVFPSETVACKYVSLLRFVMGGIGEAEREEESGVGGVAARLESSDRLLKTSSPAASVDVRLLSEP